MSLFSLVHGGGLGGWCWDELREELSARGYDSAAVDLTPDDFGAGAVHCATIVEKSLPPGSDPVLVGHSIAGLFLPLVAARRPVRRLVFLHALLPQPGRSVADQMSEEADMFNPAMFEAAAPFWEDEDVAREFLFHDCPEKVASMAFHRLRPEPAVLGREISPLDRWPSVSVAYIVCQEDRTATPTWARRAARERLGVAPIELPGGHCPMLSRPRALADALELCV
jgi:pimeloyl-ACP methyl ester carboxylesterase